MNKFFLVKICTSKYLSKNSSASTNHFFTDICFLTDVHKKVARIGANQADIVKIYVHMSILNLI